jgi:hypothetical protein
VVGKLEGERLRGCSGQRWEDSIKLHLKYVGWEAVDSIHVADVREKWRASVITAMDLSVL